MVLTSRQRDLTIAEVTLSVNFGWNGLLWITQAYWRVALVEKLTPLDKEVCHEEKGFSETVCCSEKVMRNASGENGGPSRT